MKKQKKIYDAQCLRAITAYADALNQPARLSDAKQHKAYCDIFTNLTAQTIEDRDVFTGGTENDVFCAFHSPPVILSRTSLARISREISLHHALVRDVTTT
jgi:hypothetical protein